MDARDEEAGTRMRVVVDKGIRVIGQDRGQVSEEKISGIMFESEIVDMVCATVFMAGLMAGCSAGEDGKDVNAGSAIKDWDSPKSVCEGGREIAM